MQWHSLEKDKAALVIEKLKDEGLPGLFTPRVGDLRQAKLPFYNDWFVWRLGNYTTLPPFYLDFLGNGEEFAYLDGTSKPFSFVNDRGALVLNRYTVLDYLSFYYSHVGDGEDEVAVIRSEEDLPGLHGAKTLPRSALIEALGTISIEPAAQGEGFTVTAPLYLGGTLVSAAVSVDSRGIPEIRSRRMLVGPQGKKAGAGGMIAGNR